jgi:hypothetical protein
MAIKNMGDPFVLRVPDGKYYCFATSARDGFKAWTSDDLVNWHDIGYVYRVAEIRGGLAIFGLPRLCSITEFITAL